MIMRMIYQPNHRSTCGFVVSVGTPKSQGSWYFPKEKLANNLGPRATRILETNWCFVSIFSGVALAGFCTTWSVSRTQSKLSSGKSGILIRHITSSKSVVVRVVCPFLTLGTAKTELWRTHSGTKCLQSSGNHHTLLTMLIFLNFMFVQDVGV